jgi:hypothetical protein
MTRIENFDWQETYMIDEVPKDDIWNNFATEKKLKLENHYIDLNMPKECSKHYMAFNPVLDKDLTQHLDPFLDKLYHYNFLKLTPGYNLWWHYDSYSTFVKHNNITEGQAENINRTIVMLTPWAHGQVLQIGDKTIANWNVGDTFSWSAYTWHGVGNFGFTDFIVMQITWIDK